MQLSPFLGNNTKSLIVSIISESSLSLKELHLELIKQSNKNISYQATHKAVNELVKDEVIEKIGKNLSINDKWINDLSKLSEKLQTKETTTSEAKVYHFDTFIDMGKFCVKFLNSLPPTTKPGACFTRHAWPFFGLSDNDYKELQKLLTETKYYEIIHYDTPLDKIFGKAIQDAGKIIKIGSKLDYDYDFMIKGDTIVQIHFSPDFKKRFHQMFISHKNLDEFPISKIIDQFLIKKTDINVFVVKDATAVNRASKVILEEF